MSRQRTRRRKGRVSRRKGGSFFESVKSAAKGLSAIGTNALNLTTTLANGALKTTAKVGRLGLAAVNAPSEIITSGLNNMTSIVTKGADTAAKVSHDVLETLKSTTENTMQMLTKAGSVARDVSESAGTTASQVAKDSGQTAMEISKNANYVAQTASNETGKLATAALKEAGNAAADSMIFAGKVFTAFMAPLTSGATNFNAYMERNKQLNSGLQREKMSSSIINTAVKIFTNRNLDVVASFKRLIKTQIQSVKSSLFIYQKLLCKKKFFGGFNCVGEIEKQVADYKNQLAASETNAMISLKKLELNPDSFRLEIASQSTDLNKLEPLDLQKKLEDIHSDITNKSGVRLNGILRGLNDMLDNVNKNPIFNPDYTPQSPERPVMQPAASIDMPVFNPVSEDIPEQAPEQDPKQVAGTRRKLRKSRRFKRS